MNPTPVTPSDSSCVFGCYTGCADGEFMLSAFTATDMSSSVSSSDSDDSLKGDNVIDPHPGSHCPGSHHSNYAL